MFFQMLNFQRNPSPTTNSPNNIQSEFRPSGEMEPLLQKPINVAPTKYWKPYVFYNLDFGFYWFGNFLGFDIL